MTNTRYRVREHQGKFTVEGYFEYHRQIYWLLPIFTDEYDWFSANEIGSRYTSLSRIHPAVFDTLEAAMNKIKEFNSPVVYHYPVSNKKPSTAQGSIQTRL